MVEDYLKRKVGDELPRMIGPAGPIGRISAIVIMPLFGLVCFLLANHLGPVMRVMLIVLAAFGGAMCFCVGLILISHH